MGLVNETALLPAFLDGKPKLLLIDGKLVPALSGRTFETINPSTGKVLAQVAEAGEADIDLAVAAARRAGRARWCDLGGGGPGPRRAGRRRPRPRANCSDKG